MGETPPGLKACGAPARAGQLGRIGRVSIPIDNSCMMREQLGSRRLSLHLDENAQLARHPALGPTEGNGKATGVPPP